MIAKYSLNSDQSEAVRRVASMVSSNAEAITLIHGKIFLGFYLIL